MDRKEFLEKAFLLLDYELEQLMRQLEESAKEEEPC